MPAWRCSICGVNYPPDQNMKSQGKCGKCGSKLGYFTNQKPDDDWQQNLEGTQVVESKAEIPADQDAVSWASPHPDNDSCPMIYQDGTDTVHVLQKSLQQLGYYPEVGDVVKLNGKYYELLGYEGKKMMWWIQRVDVDIASRSLDDIPNTYERHEWVLDPENDLDLIVKMPPPWELTDNDPED